MQRITEGGSFPHGSDPGSRGGAQANLAISLLISLLTVVMMLAPVELLARRIYRSSAVGPLSCMVLNDSVNGPHAIPNSTCTYKIAEGQAVEYRFNSCGYRAANFDCRPKQSGTYRIALVGTSMAEGLHVPWGQTIAALLPKELSRETGRKIEVYDAALEWESPRLVDLRLKQTLKAEPDLILWPLTNWDIENASLLVPPSDIPIRGNQLSRTWQRLQKELRADSLSQVLADNCKRFLEIALPGTVMMTNHILSESQDAYVKRFLMSVKDTEYLKSNFDQDREDRLQAFENYSADIQRRAKAAGVNVVVTLLPSRGEAELISRGEWPTEYNPYALGARVRSIVERQGGSYIDVLESFRKIPDAGGDYYPVDGHLNARGQAQLSDLLARHLSNLTVPPFTASVSSQSRDPLHMP